MIKIERAKREKRERDKKRKRLILKIGNYCFHLTRDEAEYLLERLRKI